MKKLAGFFAIILGFTGIAYCGQDSRIELNDGGVIKGEVLSFTDGAYTVDSTTLGKVTIPAYKIRKIEMPGQASEAPGNLPIIPGTASLKTKIDQVHGEITNNPEMMKAVNSLANDPHFQEALKDPQLVTAAKSGDVNALMQNEKFMKLLDNAKVKEIEGKLKEEKQ